MHHVADNFLVGWIRQEPLWKVPRQERQKILSGILVIGVMGSLHFSSELVQCIVAYPHVSCHYLINFLCKVLQGGA